MARIVPATEEWIVAAANVIREGGIVAFPTETVYGLGANPLDAAAVELIYQAKGRPATNPVIVHIADINQLDDLITSSTNLSSALINAFWPGPLTLVFPKSERVSDIVTAGGSTVAVRMPHHPIALSLIRNAGLPIAAPSANRSEEVSPTTAKHVQESLGDLVDLILDGGPCQVGIESTVLNMTTDPPTLLRPGAISAARIAAVIGVQPASPTTNNAAPAQSPGQMRRHYAPQTPLHITAEVPGDAHATDLKMALISYDLTQNAPPNILLYKLPNDPIGYGKLLYATLRELDTLHFDLILVQQVPETDDWLPIRDRLARASERKQT